MPRPRGKAVLQQISLSAGKGISISRRGLWPLLHGASSSPYPTVIVLAVS